MQIKTFSKMAIIPKMAIPNAGEEAEQEVLSLVADKNAN